MRGYDVAIVRLLPFALFIDMGIQSIFALEGFSNNDYRLLHSNSAIYASALFFISLANKHYHCNWNRAMYVFLIIVPLFNYVDAKLNLVPTVDVYVKLFHIMYGITAAITAWMAFKHFTKPRKKKQ